MLISSASEINSDSRFEDIRFTIHDRKRYQPYTVYEDALITPQWCYTNKGAVIPETANQMVPWTNRLQWSINSKRSIDRKLIKYKTIDDAVLISHPYTGHWGHWLIETMAVMQPFLDNKHPSNNIYFMKDAGQGLLLNSMPKKEWLAPLNGVEKTIIPREHFYDNLTVVKKLYVPKPTFDFVNRSVYPQHVDTLQQWGDYFRSPTYKKQYSNVFVLRPSNNYRPIEGYPALEAKIQDSGKWHVVDPGALSITEQIHLFENADVIAGEISSAFHNLMLTRHFKGKVYMYSPELFGLIPTYAVHANLMNHDVTIIENSTLYDNKKEYNAKREKIGYINTKNLKHTVSFLNSVAK